MTFSNPGYVRKSVAGAAPGADFRASRFGRLRASVVGCAAPAILSALLGPLLSARAGSLDSPAPTTHSASAMVTLEDLYERFATGAAGAPRVGAFREPGAGPAAGTQRTIDEVMARAPSAQTNAATDADVVAGKAYWSLNAGIWGPRTGALEVLRLSDPDTSLVPAGYYAATNLSQVDPNLAPANIRAGMTIFGVPGKTEVVDTSSGDAAAGDIMAGKKGWVDGAEITGNVPAGGSLTGAVGELSVALPAGMYSGAKTATFRDSNLVSSHIATNVTIFGVAGNRGENLVFRLARTGQAVSYVNFDDGYHKKGLAAPDPRFTVQGNTNAADPPGDPLTNCVLDNLTGLMWARSATNAVAKANWTNALTACNALELGGYDDWRLPNVQEMRSLIDYGASAPALPAGHPFLDVPAGGYWWTSTTHLKNSACAIKISVSSGNASCDLKANSNFVWPVRGGETP